MSNAMMTEDKAYPCLRSYETRVRCEFKVGDRVLVGPAYRGYGRYEVDEWCGEFCVVHIGDNNNYYLAKQMNYNRWYDVIIGSSRLTHIEDVQRVAAITKAFDTALSKLDTEEDENAETAAFAVARAYGWNLDNDDDWAGLTYKATIEELLDIGKRRAIEMTCPQRLNGEG